MGRKFNQEEVENIFKEENCELKDIYIDARTPMKYICSCGNESFISLDNFKKGKRCKKCGKIKNMINLRLKIEDVKSVFIENNCTPLFDEYINGHTPLKYICECGEIGYTAYTDFKSGKRCGHCRIQKIHETMYKNGTQMCSSQQKLIHDLIGGELNYPINNSSLDIAFPDEKIYIEYDGSGHDLSVKKGDITQKQFDEKGRRRRYALYRNDWKEIRIISKKDYLPSDDILRLMIEQGKELLKMHSWILYDIDNCLLISKNGSIKCNFGELRRLK